MVNGVWFGDFPYSQLVGNALQHVFTIIARVVYRFSPHFSHFFTLDSLKRIISSFTDRDREETDSWNLKLCVSWLSSLPNEPPRRDQFVFVFVPSLVVVVAQHPPSRQILTRTIRHVTTIGRGVEACLAFDCMGEKKIGDSIECLSAQLSRSC